MEQEQVKETVRDIKSAGTTPKGLIKLTTFELDILNSVFNTKNGDGHAIKDLRMIDKAQKKIKSAQPKDADRPAPPAGLAANADGTPHTPEQQAGFQKLIEKYRADVDAFLAKEHDVQLDNFEKTIIRQKLSKFTQFYDHEGIRESVLSLADKFGVE